VKGKKGFWYSIEKLNALRFQGLVEAKGIVASLTESGLGIQRVPAALGIYVA